MLWSNRTIKMTTVLGYIRYSQICGNENASYDFIGHGIQNFDETEQEDCKIVLIIY